MIVSSNDGQDILSPMSNPSRDLVSTSYKCIFKILLYLRLLQISFVTFIGDSKDFCHYSCGCVAYYQTTKPRKSQWRDSSYSSSSLFS